MNKQLMEIANILKDTDNIGIFPHIRPDGDCIGSAFALYLALAKMGKKVKVVFEEDIPRIYDFLSGEYEISYNLPEGETFDVTISLDSSDETRINERWNLFKTGNTCICIDHHITNTKFADINYIDASSSATGEIIFDLINLLPYDLQKEEAINLYVAISTDTGGFMYSNTTSRTHKIVSKLLELGFDSSKINRILFDTITKGKMVLTKAVLNSLRFYEDGKISVASLPFNFFKDYGLTYEDADGLTSIPRAVEGVEIGILVTECEKSKIKVSFRSNDYANVSSLALQFGGGGHERASGCSFEGEMKDIIEIVIKTAKEFL